MSLFQKSVEKKYLNELDQAIINKKYQAFQDYFGNPERQENTKLKRRTIPGRLF
jgi:hypothetical protein